MKNNNDIYGIILASYPRNMSKGGVTKAKQLEDCHNYCSVNGIQVLKEFAFCSGDSGNGIKKMKEIIKFVHNQTHKIAIVSYNMRRLQGDSSQLTELDRNLQCSFSF